MNTTKKLNLILVLCFDVGNLLILLSVTKVENYCQQSIIENLIIIITICVLGLPARHLPYHNKNESTPIWDVGSGQTRI